MRVPCGLGWGLFFVAQGALAGSYAYGWQDAAGQWHFTDQRPAHAAAVVDLAPRNPTAGKLSESSGVAPAAAGTPKATARKSKSKAKTTAKSSAPEMAVTADGGDEPPPACAEWRDRLSLAAGPMTPSARRKMENDYDRKCVLGQR